MNREAVRRFFSPEVWNARLAKVETLLVLGLLIDGLILPWVSGLRQIPAWGLTLLKMALVAGLFGPVFAHASRFIDRKLGETRRTTGQLFLMPRLVFHLTMLCGLFILYYHLMHRCWPWS